LHEEIEEKKEPKIPEEHDFLRYSLTKKYRMYGILDSVEKKVRAEV
jgi:hypothetical protein